MISRRVRPSAVRRAKWSRVRGCVFELTDAVLCADRPVRSLVELILLAEHRRGHGAVYDALGQGR
jgi:hypothetical protein